MKKFVLAYILVILFVCCSFLSAEEPQPAEPLSQEQFTQFLDEMQKVYDATTTLSAGFEQQYQSVLGKKSKSAGNVSFKKPGKMRWTYKEPTSREFITSGTALWIVDHSEKNVLVKSDFKAVMMPESITFLWGGGKLKESFDVQQMPPKTDRPDCVRMKLIPKTNRDAFVKKLVFVVDKNTKRISEALLVDGGNNKNYLKFSNLKENAAIDDTFFNFVIPKDYQTLSTPKE